ncbi:molecular chaperone DnaK [Steroidobacter denitrificans]|uniref:RNA polymerase-binding transcription factor DksA n=1 Tax=Steroidobacter denitrificans TaxID=465721 RepID=A0A127F8V2_STEDE|nr:molecular chaperone DnaK [Steroidobacter denitrificans]
MAAKKPSVKAKAKKSAVKKAAPAKKAAARKSGTPARARTVPHNRSASKPAAKSSPAPARPAKAASAKRPAQPASTVPKTIAPPSPVIPHSIGPHHLSSHNDDSAADTDDLEQELSGLNLLSGPRNVKPYIPQRDEQYMSKEQLDHFRQILDTWKRDLMQEVDRTVLHMKDEAANFPDPNDRATQESEFSLELRTRDRERKLIRKIEEAIKRIDDGSYGYCNETGEEIGIKRLEARPVATLSVEAQERRERREKQYGDRDDRYR